jgi:hypothetical protein
LVDLAATDDVAAAINKDIPIPSKKGTRQMTEIPLNKEPLYDDDDNDKRVNRNELSND